MLVCRRSLFRFGYLDHISYRRMDKTLIHSTSLYLFRYFKRVVECLGINGL